MGENMHREKDLKFEKKTFFSSQALLIISEKGIIWLGL